MKVDNVKIIIIIAILTAVIGVVALIWWGGNSLNFAFTGEVV